jgi:competence protein ComEC
VEASVLEVPHHGSDTSSSEAWIQELAPAIAVVSVGEDNPHGHPSPKVIEVLKTHVRRVLITRDTGTILMKFDQGKNRIRYKVF